MTGSLSTAALLTGTAAGVVALVALGSPGRPDGRVWPSPSQLAGRAIHRDRRLAGDLGPGTPRPIGIFLHVVSIRQSFARLTRIEQMSAAPKIQMGDWRRGATKTPDPHARREV